MVLFQTYVYDLWLIFILALDRKLYNWLDCTQIPKFCFLWLVTLFTCHHTSASEMVFLLRVALRTFIQVNPTLYSTNFKLFPQKRKWWGKFSFCHYWKSQNMFSHWRERGHHGWVPQHTQICPQYLCNWTGKDRRKQNFVFVIYFCLLRKLTTKISDKTIHFN